MMISGKFIMNECWMSGLEGKYAMMPVNHWIFDECLKAYQDVLPLLLPLACVPYLN